MFNLHCDVIEDQIRDLLLTLNREKMPLWKQMRCLEIISAVIAENLMENGTEFYFEPEKIVWPDKTVTSPPSKTQMRKLRESGKGSKKTKHGLWGDLVNKYSSPKLDSTAPATVGVAVDVDPPHVPKRGRPKGSGTTKKKATKPVAPRKPDSDAEGDGDEESGKQKVDISKANVGASTFKSK